MGLDESLYKRSRDVHVHVTRNVTGHDRVCNTLTCTEMFAAPACGLLRAVRLTRPRGFYSTQAQEAAEGWHPIDIHHNPS